MTSSQTALSTILAIWFQQECAQLLKCSPLTLCCAGPIFSTLFGRVANLWHRSTALELSPCCLLTCCRSIAESRAAFEAEPDHGLLGKSFTRIFNVGWNYVIKVMRVSFSAEGCLR
jgi:hypothetical protein